MRIRQKKIFPHFPFPISHSCIAQTFQSKKSFLFKFEKSELISFSGGLSQLV